MLFMLGMVAGLLLGYFIIPKIKAKFMAVEQAVVNPPPPPAQ
jgi:hypothetical protein